MDLDIFFAEQGLTTEAQKAAVNAALDYLDAHTQDSVLSAMRGAVAAGVAEIARNR